MISKNLKESRKKLGYTQADLAEKIGVTPSAIGMYEQGRRDPDSKILKKICGVLNITSDFLILGGEGNKQIFGKDIESLTDDVSDFLKNQKTLLFKGKPITPEDKEKLVQAMRTATALAISASAYNFFKEKN